MSKKNSILFVTILCIGLLISAGTYAFWTWTSNVNKSVVFNVASGFEQYIIYDEGESSFIGNFQPSDNYCSALRNTISFRKTTDDVDFYATIYMNVNEIGNNISNSDSVYWIVTSGDSTGCTGNLSDALSYGTFKGKSNGSVIEMLNNIEVTTTEQKYTIWIWLDRSGDNISELSGETLNTNVWTQFDMYPTDGLSGGSVKITGNNEVGSILTANLTNTTPDADSYTYQWYTHTENLTTGGTLISGATSNTLTVTNSHVGKYIYVVVTAIKNNSISKSFSDITDIGNNKYAVVYKTVPIFTVSDTNLDISYPSNGSLTYTYDGNGIVSCNSSNIYVATCSVNTSSKTVTVVPTGAGDSVITLSASETTNYASVLQKINVNVTASTMDGGVVQITGDNIVGSTLTANLTNTTPDADSYTYQWYYNTTSSTNDGIAIDGATSSTFALTDTYLGKYIYVVVTASKIGYVNKTLIDITDSTNNTSDVVTKLIPTFTVSSSTLDIVYPNSGSFTYTYDGDGIVSCSSSDTNVATCSVNTSTKTVTVNTLYLGKSTITLSASEGDIYASSTQTVSVTIMYSGENVTIIGSNIVGNTLTATVEVNPPADNYKYQWYVSSYFDTMRGTEISGATSNTLVLDSSMVGKYIYVVVTPSWDDLNMIVSGIWPDITDATNNGTSTVVRKTPTLTVSNSSLDLIYPNSGSFTYTYEGDGTISCSSSDTSISECSVDTSTKTVTVTSKAVGDVDITLSASEGDTYSAISQTIPVSIGYQTYAINYYANITSGESAWKTESKTYGENYTITSEIPSRNGYNFLGWSTSSSDPTVIYEAGDTYSTNAVLDLYAVWEIAQFSINEDFADATYDSNITNISNSTANATLGTNSYDFLWSITDGQLKTNSVSFTAASYNATTITSGDIISTIEFTPTTDGLLSFDYGMVMNNSSSATLTIKLTGKDDVSVTAATTSTYTAGLTANTTYTLQLILSHTTRATYSFYGGTAVSTAYAYIDNLVVGGVSTYIVSYDANGGSGAPESQTKIQLENLTLSSVVPTYGDYTFVSWNTASDGSGTSYNPGGTYSADSSVTLYAIWSSFSINEDFADTTWDTNITSISTPSISASTTGGYGTQSSFNFLWSVSDGMLRTNSESFTGSFGMTRTLNSGNITSTIVFTPTNNTTLSFRYGLVMNGSSSASLTIKLTNNSDVTVSAATDTTYTASLTANTTYTLELIHSHTSSSSMSSVSTAYAFIDDLNVGGG